MVLNWKLTLNVSCFTLTEDINNSNYLKRELRKSSLLQFSTDLCQYLCYLYNRLTSSKNNVFYWTKNFFAFILLYIMLKRLMVCIVLLKFVHTKPSVWWEVQWQYQGIDVRTPRMISVVWLLLHLWSDISSRVDIGRKPAPNRRLRHVSTHFLNNFTNIEHLSYFLMVGISSCNWRFDKSWL